jgi:hypothetical protein
MSNNTTDSSKSDEHITKATPEDDENPLDISILKNSSNTRSFSDSVPESLQPFFYVNSSDTEQFHRSMAANFFASEKKSASYLRWPMVLPDSM